MSGGYFNDCGYDYYRVSQFADELEAEYCEYLALKEKFEPKGTRDD